jgi:hypothetical protein
LTLMRKKETGDHHGDYSCYGNRVEFDTESKNSKFALTISSLHSPLESGSKFAKGAKIGRGSAQKTVRMTASSPRSTEMNRGETSFRTFGGPTTRRVVASLCTICSRPLMVLGDANVLALVFVHHVGDVQVATVF